MKEIFRKLWRWMAWQRVAVLDVEQSARFASDMAGELAANGRYLSVYGAWAFFKHMALRSKRPRFSITQSVKDAFFASYEHEMEAERRRQSLTERTPEQRSGEAMNRPDFIADDVLTDLEALYERTCGNMGVWHVVLEDGNLEDDWIRETMTKHDDDGVLDDADMQRIGNALLALSETQIDHLYRWLIQRSTC